MLIHEINGLTLFVSVLTTENLADITFVCGIIRKFKSMNLFSKRVNFVLKSLITFTLM